MRISPIAIIAICTLAAPSWSAEAPKAPAPSNYKSASTTATGDPMMAPPPSAQAATPTAAPAAASPTAEAPSVSATAEMAEPVIEDDAQALTPSAALDLSKAETRLLAKISETIGMDQDKVLFNIEENAPADKAGPGVNEVNVPALYLELARRAVAEEKEARQALSLAIVRGDKRAKDAKNEAYEERLADRLIKRISNGDAGAKDELMKLALAGNKNARMFLGLDKPAVAVDAAMGATPTAMAVNATPAAEVSSPAKVSPPSKVK